MTLNVGAQSDFNLHCAHVQTCTVCYIPAHSFFVGYGITTDGVTTYINASNCDERYIAVNPPIVFDIPVPPGFTKEGNLKWLIKNEPWKNSGRDFLDNIVDSDDESE